MEKYNTIGNNYNETRKADGYLVSRMFDLLSCKSNYEVLDIGCGTGNYTIELFNKGLKISGLEPSELMLNVAKEKNQKINWFLGSAELLPFESESFDAVITTLSIHHWQNLEKGFSEIFRVLKRAGIFLIFTSTSEQMKNYWLNHYFPEMMKKSIEQMPSFVELKGNLENIGFKVEAVEKYDIKDNLEDKFLYIGKNNPKIYFDSIIRNGISSFASLTNKDEVEIGLKNLENDLIKGEFDSVKSNFPDNKGDYVFIKAKKNEP
ncbi:class I SAM-dependent methyltransferase [Epilithonimonas hungarica]|uniref:Ubiquinone/menaquinone biosynthesis C-methylase UbiE n=1 Tax=Epilithonimonas hungarica TaxID=454006 RepID=A0A1G7IDW2_9FLAO|nr:class I SAM-dependent methyltransferase [Epilithonimonas hungarica]SDF10892.1 Ubiquinone/menaquinone biosynthesis C-methylase UbiE [Epilithonimonas hungarica]